VCLLFFIFLNYLSTQYYLNAGDDTWQAAARIYVEQRHKEITINRPVDCWIAHIAMEHGAILLHHDKDFAKISRIRLLMQERFKLRQNPTNPACPVKCLPNEM